MNNLLSYCGLVYPRKRASNKDLPVQHNQLPGSYGLYRPPYGNNQQPGTPDPGSFGRAGHLGGYPFAPMPGQNPYTGYNHLGYPTSQSPVRDGKKLFF